jgi:RNA polymerase sigma factor (sigma-70 family)
MDTHDQNKKEEISEDVRIFIQQSNRVIRHFTCDLKREKIIIDGEKVTFIPSREISYDHLLEEGAMFSTGERSVEDLVIDTFMRKQLSDALDQLDEGERRLIHEIFFSQHGEEKSERQVAKSLGIPQKTINNRKLVILSKLKKMMESEK